MEIGPLKYKEHYSHQWRRMAWFGTTNITLSPLIPVIWGNDLHEVINTLPAYVGHGRPFNAFYGYTSGEIIPQVGLRQLGCPDIKPGIPIII